MSEFMLRTPSPTRAKVMAAKRIILRRTQHNFRRACDQIVLLNKRMEGVLFRYHSARSQTNRSFRYKLRLRLAIVEGTRNMFYEYANRKAHEIVHLRRDLFGEIVEVISDEAAADDFYAHDDQDAEDMDDSDDYSSDSEAAGSDVDDDDEGSDMEADYAP